MRLKATRKWSTEDGASFTTAHTFGLTSANLGMVRDILVSHGRCLLIQRYFCAVTDNAGKEVLTSKGFLKSKKKFGGKHVFFRDKLVNFWS